MTERIIHVTYSSNRCEYDAFIRASSITSMVRKTNLEKNTDTYQIFLKSHPDQPEETLIVSKQEYENVAAEIIKTYND